MYGLMGQVPGDNRSTDRRDQNVTKYLLFVYWDTDGDGSADNLTPIFDDRLEGHYWDHDGSGLKLLQLRFYDCATTVNPDGSWSDTCGRTGTHEPPQLRRRADMKRPRRSPGPLRCRGGAETIRSRGR